MHKDDENTESPFLPEDPIPVPDDMPVLYVTMRETDCKNENWADRHPETVVPGTGWRFISYNIPSHEDGMTFDDRHHDGYNYGFAHVPYKSVSGFWGEDPQELSTHMFRLRLKYANDIYVVDEAPFLEAREHKRDERDAKGTADEDVSDLDSNQVFSAIAGTLTPLSEYEGGYKKPIYLIGRPLGIDEAVPYIPQFKQKMINEDIARRNRPNPLLDELFSDQAAPKKEAPETPIAEMQSSAGADALAEEQICEEAPSAKGEARIIPFKPR